MVKSKYVFVAGLLLLSSFIGLTQSTTASAAGTYYESFCTTSSFIMQKGGTNATFEPGKFCMLSTDRKYRVVFQFDGNLVVYNANGAASWSSKTYSQGATAFSFQSDGNLVIYRNTTALWSSRTSGQWFNATTSTLRITMQNDGNFVEYKSPMFSTDNQTALWSSKYGRTY
jgi:hypothetical protein